MSYEVIALLMFSTMMLMLLTGQRVFGAIGFVAVAASLLLWGDGGSEIAFSAGMKLMKWYPLLTLPLFIYMGYVLSESGIAEDLYQMFHVWMGPLNGGLAIGTIGLMVVISAMNGLSVAGMAIGASIALPELLRRGYDKIMVTGVIQAGSSLGILVPPSVVLVLYGMIARQPVGQLWLAGVFPGLLMAGLFILYIVVRCWVQPNLGPALPKEERTHSWGEKLVLLRAGILPLLIFFLMTGLFLLGYTSLVESSAVGALAATLAALVKRRLNRKVMEDTIRKTLSISCMFMWIILAAMCFGAVFDGLGAVKAIEAFFIDRMSLGPWEILIMMQLSYILMGMFLDDTAMLVIVAPLYIPLVKMLGFDLVWYGVLYTITCQIAYMTPPFGYNLFLMRAMAPPEVSLADIYRSIIPFVMVMALGLALVIMFPQIALWLPHYHYEGISSPNGFVGGYDALMNYLFGEPQ
jgi:tripartite ATP-independent transporter DctM subunit